MNATYPENARLKAVASPCLTTHSCTPGDCTPPVYMPPVTSMDKYEAESVAHDAHMVGITLRNSALTTAARDLYFRIGDDGLDLPDIDSLYACVAFAASLTPPLETLSVPVHQQPQISEPAGGAPCATTVVNFSSRGASAAPVATVRARKNTSLTNTRLWSQTLKKPKSIGLKNRTLGAS